ncbi:hypothetical protein [Paracoccus sp. SSK6]|uniref:hypothetical protein n=1 Tax=Paracoccus sp. SSK6 TaxID=3143131 RepID=UPI00321BF4B4
MPLVDLKAGDELYANVLLALAEGADRAGGRRIDVSMMQAAASWLITLLPLIDLDCGPEEITRWGMPIANSFRQIFIRHRTAIFSSRSAAMANGSA